MFNKMFEQIRKMANLISLLVTVCALKGHSLLIMLRDGLLPKYKRLVWDWFSKIKKACSQLWLTVKAQYLIIKEWKLEWWMVLVLRQLVNGISLFIGLCLGTLWTIGMYDDGLERVLDVYNYFKNPPRK